MVHELPSEKSQLLQASCNLHPTPPRGGCLSGLLISIYSPRPNSNVTFSVESHVTPPTHTQRQLVLSAPQKCSAPRISTSHALSQEWTQQALIVYCYVCSPQKSSQVPELGLKHWSLDPEGQICFLSVIHSTGIETMPITGSINCRKINTSWAVPGDRWSRPSFPTSWMKKVRPGIEPRCLYKLLSCLWRWSFSPLAQWL